MTRYIFAEEVRNTLDIKKSQFITWVKKIESREEAMSYLEEAKRTYPDARHHCWAYVMGDTANSQTAAMSDDGEPSGTAGKPMLNVLQHKPVNDVMVIVIRYFGGIKLGAGGLVRAYSQAVEQAFSLGKLTPVIKTLCLDIEADFANEQWVRHLLARHDGEVLDVSYGQKVMIKIRVPESSHGEFCASLDARGIGFTFIKK